MAPDVKTAQPAGGVAALPPAGAAERGSFGRFLRWDTLVGLLLVLVFIGGSASSPGFASIDNLSFALGDLGEIALIALAMTMLVVAAEVDLSVASVLGLSSALVGALWDAGWAIETIIPLVVVIGAACGLVNGLLVTRLGLPSLAVTIGTLALYRGLAYVVLGDRAIAEFPQQYTSLAVDDIPGTPIPYPVALFILLAIITAVVLHATGFGRSLFAIGAQEEAALFAGIRVKRVKLILFVLSGTVAAFAGVVFTLRYGSARADNGMGLELAVIAAVLLGGVDFDGGRGTLGGVIAGVLLIGLLRNLLMLNDVSTEIQSIVTGLLLIISVITPRLVAVIGQRRRRPSPVPSPAPPAS
ncbi:rhamnose transport system permease protein [Streptosporangium becharense]|uniref:Autoinducer 2 import system permease protein LsrD n=1 Tax=Streptosporangium becharense TaxID=1816182 RepID=A0A7W9IBB7_9ACTN|nr:ABC transporter permease [Streptosporangium becharense]MBB2915405.1 rhamnose transport system permease protein [Streptosporangium becharense]MBB5817592.1 rhamnose transport system permease protein [Streptosporangium becharense]